MGASGAARVSEAYDVECGNNDQGLVGRLVVVEGERWMAACGAEADVAAAVSGTAVLELALGGVPMVAIYQANCLTAWMARRLAVVP